MININVLGNVGREPEAKFIGDGEKKVVKFSVAMQNYFAKNEEDRTKYRGGRAPTGCHDPDCTSDYIVLLAAQRHRL